jgi:hypothetical protein
MRTSDAFELQSLALGLPTVDDYLPFVVAWTADTWLATAYDCWSSSPSSPSTRRMSRRRRVRLPRGTAESSAKMPGWSAWRIANMAWRCARSNDGWPASRGCSPTSSHAVTPESGPIPYRGASYATSWTSWTSSARRQSGSPARCGPPGLRVTRFKHQPARVLSRCSTMPRRGTATCRRAAGGPSRVTRRQTRCYTGCANQPST